MKSLKWLVLGAYALLAGCTTPCDQDTNSSDNEIFQFRAAYREEVEELVDVGVIPGHTSGEDVPSAIYFKLTTYWLDNPQFKNDRFIVGQVTEKFWGIIPFSYQKSIIRLPKDFPVPDANGLIDGKAYILYVLEFYNQFKDSWFKPCGYDSNYHATVVFHWGHIIDKTLDDYVLFDFYDSPASRCDQLKVLDIGETRTIGNVSDYLWTKYDIEHNKEKWFTPEFIRVFNNPFGISYSRNGDGYHVYVHINGYKTWYESLLGKIGFKDFQDTGIYIDNYAPRHFSTDEYGLFLDMCKVADEARATVPGTKYDGIYRYCDDFKYNQIKTGSLIYNDIIRWVYCDKESYGRNRRDVESHRHVVYKKDRYWNKPACMRGFKYSITLAKNNGRYSDRSDSFDYICRIINASNDDGKDTKTVCGTASITDFPVWEDGSDPSDAFLNKVVDMSYKVIRDRQSLTNATTVVTDRQGKFSIYTPDGKIADETLYGVDGCFKTEMWYDNDYWTTYDVASWYTKQYDNCSVVYSKSFTSAPYDMTGLEPGHMMRIYAIREPTNGALLIFTMRFDPVTYRQYDRYLIYAKKPDHQFFKEGSDPFEECNKISAMVTKFRNNPFHFEDHYECDMYKQGVFIVNGVPTDPDFTGSEEYNTELEKSYRLILAH